MVQGASDAVDLEVTDGEGLEGEGDEVTDGECVEGTDGECEDGAEGISVTFSFELDPEDNSPLYPTFMLIFTRGVLE